MTKLNHNQLSGAMSLGKFGDLIFTRQTPVSGANTHRSMFSEIVGRIQNWRAERAASAELAGLSDRELSDIGVSREQISSLTRIRR
jgi:uncharacterized protein YjiS (DUF1127 family)